MVFSRLAEGFGLLEPGTGVWRLALLFFSQIFFSKFFFATGFGALQQDGIAFSQHAPAGRENLQA
jgi:hypothetical protein